MREDFLHYLWKYQKFAGASLKTVAGNSIRVSKPGMHNSNEGPDFFNAQLEIDGQNWAGNVEIHCNSSHWYTHHHETDSNYDNVILHVVWNHDASVYRKDNTVVPTLQLKDVVPSKLVQTYQQLFLKPGKWINCEHHIVEVPQMIKKNWLERLYIERLEMKSKLLLQELDESVNHWEALLFRLLCKSFGLDKNGNSFLSISKSLPFSVWQKTFQDVEELEALLFGQAGLLTFPMIDSYYNFLQERYIYLRRKHGIRESPIIPVKFFRLRPPNFPTIRLSQLAVLFSAEPHLFSKIMEAKSIEDYYNIFQLGATSYWDTHYNFEVSSSKRKKNLTKKFIDLLIINAVIPLKFCHAVYIGKDASEEVLKLARSIHSEENYTVRKFESFGLPVSNAMDSQGVLELKKSYCDLHKCLDCAMGNALLKAQ